jgi:succinate dehydrogenase / fumarate reductase cytochrome b subunit
VNSLSAFTRSSIGKKYIVAITGVILVGFIVGHLLGNLQIFFGPEYINSYAEKLRSLGALLWIIRAGLLVVVVLHIYFTIRLAIDNRRARPVLTHRKSM